MNIEIYDRTTHIEFIYNDLAEEYNEVSGLYSKSGIIEISLDYAQVTVSFLLSIGKKYDLNYSTISNHSLTSNQDLYNLLKTMLI